MSPKDVLMYLNILPRYQYDIYSQSWDMMKVFLGSPHDYKEIVVGRSS